MPTSSIDAPAQAQAQAQAKKARLSTASAAAPTTDIKTTQLYVLSSRKHRDATKSALQRAKIERDRANANFLQAQQWLKDANDNIAKCEEELKEAQEEYNEAKGLSAVQMAEVQVDESDDEDSSKKRKRGSTGGGKYKKAPMITDLLMDMAKSGRLVDGKKLHEVDCDVGSRDQAKFVNAMCLVEELWTEEEELFLRSPPSEISESLEELRIICMTIGERCLAKLCEWEGREDTGRQKPSLISVGIRARKCFLSRAKVAKSTGEEMDITDETSDALQDANETADVLQDDI